MPGPIEPVTCEVTPPVALLGACGHPVPGHGAARARTCGTTSSSRAAASSAASSPAPRCRGSCTRAPTSAARTAPTRPTGAGCRITDWAGRNEENLTGIESIAADPVDPNRVYIAAGQYLTAGNGQILSSTDMGRTWTRNNIAAPMGGNVNGRSMGERLADRPEPAQHPVLRLAHRGPVEEHGLCPDLDCRQRFPDDRRRQLRQRRHELRRDVRRVRSAQRRRRAVPRRRSTSATARRPGPRCIARPTRGRPGNRSPSSPPG